MSKVILTIIYIVVIIAILSPIISLIAQRLFRKKVKKEVKALFANIKDEKEIITEDDLKKVPLNVGKWLKNSNVVGKQKIHAARLKQYGVMRFERNKPWMPTFANQFFNVDTPGFIWKAKIRMAPFFNISARDKFYKGKANMLIKFLTFNIANKKGKKLDQSTALRYLAEIMWFPTAAVSEYISWEEIDPYTAKATFNYKDINVSGIFKYNEEYEVVNFIADRYMDNKGEFTLEKWSTPIDEYKVFNGIKIPSKGRVVWKLADGDFCWYKFKITKIDYNKPYFFSMNKHINK